MSLCNSLKWIDSYGGPLLLLEKCLLDKWRGVHVKNSQVLESDYDRACTVENYVGLVTVGAEHAMVIAGEPLMTMWFAPEPQNGMLVRWVYANNESEVIAALVRLQNEIWQDTQLKADFSDGKLVLFDAACEGVDLPYKIEIEIPGGNYRIETCHYKPDAETYLILHRFV